MRRPTLLAGIGGIGFGVLTSAALLVGNQPGGGYKASDAVDYVAKGHHVAAIAAGILGLLGVFGLICLLTQLRATIGVAPENQLAGIAWGTGLAAAASLAVGWSVAIGQPIGHAEGGSGVVIPPAVTYLISEIGAVFIFGSGAVLLGLALIAFMLGGRAHFPTWLRWLTLATGVFGLAGLAFFPFFLVLLWGVVAGVWLLATGRPPARPA